MEKLLLSRISKCFFFLLFTIIISRPAFSQNVAINVSGNPPNAAAGLDVDFSNKGILIPRVALTGTANFAPLTAHVAGMIVYNTATTGDVNPGFYYNNGVKWVAGFPTGNSIGNMLYWDGTNWVMIPAGLPGQYLQVSGTNLPVWGSLIPAIPSIVTATATSITGTTATTGANITSDGGNPVLTRGICYGTLTGPTIGGTKVTDASGGTGIFVSNMTGLLPVTTYYVRGFAINSTSVNYGNEISFTTLPVLPTLAATTAASLITGNTATSGGNVTATGGSPIIERGICYATTVNPTVANTKIIDPTPGLGSFVSNLTGLAGYTTYYVRAYATNSIGTAYGTQISFATLRLPPTLVTVAATSITGATAISGSSMSWNGGGFSNFQNYGVAYSTVPNAPTPTKVATNTANGSVNPAVPIAPWVTNITGLAANTTYYIRGYLELYPTGTGPWTTYYGNELTFTTTAPTAPVVGSTTAITNISDRTGTSGGTITSDGGSAITVKGVCWSTSPNPTLGVNNFTTNGTGTAAFGSPMTGLNGSTTYYVRAYATNAIGTSYGPADVTFTTWVTAPYTLGQNLGYGYCAYVAPDGTGFIVSVDIPSTAPWGCSGTLISTSTALGTGLANTNLILANCATRPIAASVAKNYTGGGFNDWYLPSDGEWQKIAANYTMFGFPGPYINYLTSSASSLTYAGSYFYTGSQAYYMGSARAGGDTYATQLRAIRSFSSASLPVVTTTSISNIGPTTATGGGNATADGGSVITARGVCWSTTTGPTVALSTKTNDGTGLGAFVSSISGLNSGVTYYVRAYATNAAGTAYGTEVSFTANAAVLVPTVTTDPMGSLVGNLAEANYTVVNEGATPVVAAGIIWSTSPGATVTSYTGIITDPFYFSGSSVGISWPLDMTGLIVGTTYYVRTFATNNDGTGYGADVSFTASAATIGQTVQLNWASGVVFSINNGGANGLIALNFSPGGTYDWGCPNITGATGTAVGTGDSNTNLILADIIGGNGCGSAVGSFGVEVCKFYGSGEWYLPSRDEMTLLWANRAIDPVLDAMLNSDLLAAPFWSSTESDANNAFSYNGTTWTPGLKTLTNSVTPIRSF